MIVPIGVAAVPCGFLFCRNFIVTNRKNVCIFTDDNSEGYNNKVLS